MNPDLIPESIVAVDAGDSFRKVPTVSHPRMARPEYGRAAHPWHCLQADPTEVNCRGQENRGRILERKEEAEQHGLELCKDWIGKRP